MGRPKKNIEQIEKEIMSEMPGGHSSEANPFEKDSTIAVLEPEGVDGSNEFNDTPDYTIQVIMDNGVSVDPTTLPKKDPNYAYRFLRDDPKNLSKKTSALPFQMGGWQIVPKEHAVKKCGIDEKMLAADGSYRAGELILAFMPKKLYDKKMAEDQRKTNERMGSVNRMLQGGDPDADVPHPSMVGIQAGKMDGGRVVLGVKNKGITKGTFDKG